MTRYARRYRRIARSLGSAELRAVSMSSFFDERDLVLWRKGQPRFLDFYGDDGLRLALERYGIYAAAQRRGYADLQIETHADDERHTLIVRGLPADGAEPVRVAEAVVRRDRLIPEVDDGLPKLEQSYEVLTIDWLVLRNPRASFVPARPRLPGQDAPGLGMGERVFELFCRAAERLRLEAVVSTAEYFHNAVLYVALMPFLDPRSAGRLRSLMQLLMLEHKLSLAQASWAVDWGCVREGSEEFRWKGDVQLWPRAPSLEHYLSSKRYHRRVVEESNACSFRLDREHFEERWDAERADLEGER